MYSDKTRLENYKKILHIKGYTNQIIKASEEVSELLKALFEYIEQCHSTNTDTKIARLEECATAIEEECADVWNMINQLAIIFNFSDRLEAIADIKTHKVLEDIARESLQEDTAETL